METLFTPFTSFGGGLLLGLSAALLMLGLGRIMGASGIFWGVLFPTSQTEFAWRFAMVLGMISAPVVLFAVTGTMPDIDVPISPVMVAIGGLIVGFGASLGSGCTSGHGICGLPRLSVRSLVAVPTFMTTAAITVFLIRHVFGIGG